MSRSSPSRRSFLAALGTAPLSLALPRLGLGMGMGADSPRKLSFYHLHTDEQLEVTYFERGGYVNDALVQINQLLRDFRTGEVAAIDPRLLDLLHATARVCERDRFEIISGYRSPVTNATLAEKSGGVARNSLHMEGRAIDVRMSGLDTWHLRNAGVALELVGVGYYPESNFVHLDTGRFRTWGPGAA